MAGFNIIIETGAIFKLCMLHTESDSFFIHFFHKGFFGTCYFFCHCDGGIVRTCNGDTFDHRIDCLRFIWF